MKKGLLRLVILIATVGTIAMILPRTYPSIQEYIFATWLADVKEPHSVHTDGQYFGAEQTVMTFARDNGLDYEQYPESLVELLERNPETETFVLEYPMEYGKDHTIDLREYADTETVPLFMQWDQRWGYMDYGDDVAGLTGCGPVCLSMAAVYVTGDPMLDPGYMITFAKDHGFCVPGSGSEWSLISEGGELLGLDVTQIPLDRDRIFRNLEVNNPIICVMGPGDFTTSGHFVVMTGCSDGLIRINDPNSRANSEKLWDYEDIKDQILNLWVIR